MKELLSGDYLVRGNHDITIERIMVANTWDDVKILKLEPAQVIRIRTDWSAE